jgi:hypothetical protein
MDNSATITTTVGRACFCNLRIPRPSLTARHFSCRDDISLPQTHVIDAFRRASDCSRVCESLS